MGSPKSSRLARRFLAGATIGLLAAMPTYAAQSPYRPVADDILQNAGSDNGWLMFNRDHAPFTQIDTGNVGRLAAA